jgi:hypothetical protein
VFSLTIDGIRTLTGAGDRRSIMATTLRERLIGAWKLVSYVATPTDGSPPLYPMGENPMGIILYVRIALPELDRADAAARR